MAIPKEFIEKMFVKVSSDRYLKPEVKAWFLIFSLEDPTSLVFRNSIRDPFQFSDFSKFMIRHGVVDINQVRPCLCLRCDTPVDSSIHKVLGMCYNCNKHMCAVSPMDKLFLWNNHHGSAEFAPCKCCGTTISNRKFEAAHIIASYFGGQATPDNIVPTCSSCNAAMGRTDLRVYSDELCTIRRLLENCPEFRATMEARWQALVCAWNPTLSG